MYLDSLGSSRKLITQLSINDMEKHFFHNRLHLRRFKFTRLCQTLYDNMDEASLIEDQGEIRLFLKSAESDSSNSKDFRFRL